METEVKEDKLVIEREVKGDLENVMEALEKRTEDYWISVHGTDKELAIEIRPRDGGDLENLAQKLAEEMDSNG